MSTKKPRKSIAKVATKPALLLGDKIFGVARKSQKPSDSLLCWAEQYFLHHVKDAPKGTERAKKRDLTIFLSFYTQAVGHDHVDGWTPSVNKQFQKHLSKTIVERTGKPYKSTTINRTMATLRHFGRWLHRKRPLGAGDPFENVKDIYVESPAWKGISPHHLLRLKSACDLRLKACTRPHQNPLLEASVFYTIINTGLREFEVSLLNVSQYHHRGFFQVIGKGNHVEPKVPVPSEAREHLDRYLETRESTKPADPLFVNRFENRITPKDIYRIFERLSEQASAHLPKKEKFVATPHDGRHTFLKKMAKHGIHFAQKLSRNRSVREVFRYIQPSEEEILEKVESSI